MSAQRMGDRFERCPDACRALPSVAEWPPALVTGDSSGPWRTIIVYSRVQASGKCPRNPQPPADRTPNIAGHRLDGVGAAIAQAVGVRADSWITGGFSRTRCVVTPRGQRRVSVGPPPRR